MPSSPQELQARGEETEAKLKESQGQLAARAKKIQELESAVETAHVSRQRAEKELSQRAAAAESRANEATARLTAIQKDRKEAEVRLHREVEELTAKQKGELDRRDAIKAQELGRLQAALQEKSKQLKVVELELQRYKTKGPAAARPAARPARPPAAAPRRPPEERTVSAPKPVAAKAPPPAAEPIDEDEGDRTVMIQVGSGDDEWSKLLDNLEPEK